MSEVNDVLEALIKAGAKKAHFLEIEVTEKNFSQVAEALQIPIGRKESAPRVLNYLEEIYNARIEPSHKNHQKAVLRLDYFRLKYKQLHGGL